MNEVLCVKEDTVNDSRGMNEERTLYIFTHDLMCEQYCCYPSIG